MGVDLLRFYSSPLILIKGRSFVKKKIFLEHVLYNRDGEGYPCQMS